MEGVSAPEPIEKCVKTEPLRANPPVVPVIANINFLAPVTYKMNGDPPPRKRRRKK